MKAAPVLIISVVSCVRFSKYHRHEARFSSPTSSYEIACIKNANLNTLFSISNEENCLS